MSYFSLQTRKYSSDFRSTDRQTNTFVKLKKFIQKSEKLFKNPTLLR